MPSKEIPAEKDKPEVVEQQLEAIQQGDHKFDIEQPSGKFRFEPDKGLPVWIDYRNPRNPFELYEQVAYTNGPVKVIMPAGFKCDASSTPWSVWLLPTIPQLIVAMMWYLEASTQALAASWGAGLVLSVVLPWAMPEVGQLGLHARAVFIHNALYRTQVVSRVVADALCMEVMEYDRVAWLARWVIYLPLRVFGGRAWRRNTARLASVDKGEQVSPPGPEPLSELAITPEKQNKRDAKP